MGRATCRYSSEANKVRDTNDTAYHDLEYLKDEIAPALAENFGQDFNLTEDDFKKMLFTKSEEFIDSVAAERYEGIKQAHNWSHEELKIANRMLTEVLLRPFDDKARRLWVTKQLEKPMLDIIHILIGRHQNPRYRLYSAHDTNVANIVRQINPSYDFDHIPFAANIYIELHKLASTKRRAVRVMYNGKPLLLEKCGGKEFCSVGSFFAQMRTQLYTGNLRKACDHSYKHTEEDGRPNAVSNDYETFLFF